MVGKGRLKLVKNRCPIGISEKDTDLRQQRQREQPVVLARYSGEIPGRECIEAVPRLAHTTELSVKGSEYATPHRIPRVLAGHAVHHVLDFEQTTLVAPHGEGLQPEAIQRLIGVCLLAVLQPLGEDLLSSFELSVEERMQSADDAN